MTPKKSLGQNFLMHPRTAERIVHAAELPRGMTVLEIGPGTGMLTRALLARGYTVVAVETDGALVEKLQETFTEEVRKKKLTIVHDDIRRFDTGLLPKRYALVANIPYYLTGEIIRSFLTAEHKPYSMTLLVQKEVAERIARQGKRPKESLLSLGVKAFGKPRYCFTVPRGAFRPAPKVDSAVISIRDIKKDAFKNNEEEAVFFELLRAGFAHKRKLLASNLASLHPLTGVHSALETAGLPPKVRAEDLSLSDWQRLAGILH